MRFNKQFPTPRKILSLAIVLAIFWAVFGAGGLPLAHALILVSSGPSQIASTMSASEVVGGYILSDGQFVYGPNIGDFNIQNYLEANAPHLLKYADDLYGHSKYFSINPKIYLTLLEIHSHLISAPEAALVEAPFGLSNGGFIPQIEYISNKMSDAYYLHLYTYSAMPVSQRYLELFVTPSGDTINVAPDTNAGTYAIIAGLAALDQPNISLVLDDSQFDGFYQTYARLFKNDDPLDETNHIYIPGEVGALAAPDNLLQFPWLQGQSWFFGGVHSNGSGGSGAPFTNAAALDFSPGGISWGSDTSNMWVVASASGIPTKTSNCGFSILHGDGWETGYYHIENIQNFSGTINQNDKIGVIANTLAEAICDGGNASGPHVHFYLSHNGALTAINGTPLSGWYVHAGRWEYDTDSNYMWFERSGIKKYANINRVLSEGLQAVSVSKAGAGSGMITSNPSGINCGVECTGTYFSSTTVTLTAAPTDGSMFFAGWSGACSGTGSCIVTMTGAKSVTAIFNLKSHTDMGMLTTAFNYNEGWRVEMHPRMMGDVNGDGRDDLVGFGYTGVYVALAKSVGTGFDAPSMWTTAFNYNEGWRVDMHPRMLGDVNGDGKADLIGFGYAGVFVAKSTGTGFGTPSMWTTAFNYNEGWRVNMHPRMVGDVNGDGKDDLIGDSATSPIMKRGLPLLVSDLLKTGWTNFRKIEQSAKWEKSILCPSYTRPI